MRVLWAWASGQLAAWPNELYDDRVYLDMALAILGKRPELAITHPPGYAAFLALFLALGNIGVGLARFVQMSLGAALAPGTARLARKLGFSEESAWAAGVLVAIHPMMIYFSPRLSSETLFAALVLLFFLAWIEAWGEGSLPVSAAAGCFGGLASLVRGVMLPFGGALALAACLKRREQPRWPALILACGALWAGTLAPWTARNWLRFGHFVPVSVQGGWNFYEGLTLDLDEIEWKRPFAMGQEAKALGLKDPFATDAHFGAKARAWVLEHPGGFAYLTLRKAFKFWRLAPYPPHPKAVRLGVGLFNLLFFALALCGCLKESRSKGFIFLVAWAAYLTALHALFASDLRYRLPLEPMIAIAAGAGLAFCRARANEIKSMR